jgi:protease I
MKALIISTDNFEDAELLVPYYRLKEAGVEVTVASLNRGAITGKHGYEVAVDKTLDEVNPDDYAILVLSGGKIQAVVRRKPKRWRSPGVFSPATNLLPPSATDRKF